MGVACSLSLAGCGEDNETSMMKTEGGKTSAPGVTPPNAIRNSADFNKQNQGAMNDPANKKAYRQGQ